MREQRYRLFLYRPAAANYVVDSNEYRAEFLGELKADNVSAEIKLQEISTLSFTLPENILGEFNQRLDEVLDNYVVELWYGKLDGSLGADFFPQNGDRIRFIISQSVFQYNNGVKTFTYEANSLEHTLEFKQVFNWPGILVDDLYRTIRYDNAAEEFIEVESGANLTYQIQMTTNDVPYVEIPTTFVAEPFEIFVYQNRRNANDPIESSENSIIEFSRDIDDPIFKEGFYVPIKNTEGKVTALQIALPKNLDVFGAANPDDVFEIFLYDNPLKRNITVVTDSTNELNQPEKQTVEVAQNETVTFKGRFSARPGSDILKDQNPDSLLFSKIKVGTKIEGLGITPGTIVEEIFSLTKELKISNVFTGAFNVSRIFDFTTENIITIPAAPDYNFSVQSAYSIHGLKLEHILLGTQQTRNDQDEIDNSTLTIDGILFDTGFSIGEIHPEIAEKFRSNIELNNITIYEAIKNIAESFDSIAVFDSINKTVSFYPDKNEEAFENNGLIITKENYLKNVNNDINATKIVTQAIAAGKDNLGIQLVNPTGSRAWEDYSYFLDSYYVKFDSNSLLSFTVDNNLGIDISNFPTGGLARWIEPAEALKLGKWQYTRDYFHNILLGKYTPTITAHERYINLYQVRDEAIKELVKEETKYFELKAQEFKYKYIYEHYISKVNTDPSQSNEDNKDTFEEKYNDALAASAEALEELNLFKFNLSGTLYDGTIPDVGQEPNDPNETLFTKFSEIQNFLDKEIRNIDLQKLKIFQKEGVMTDSQIDNEYDLLEALEIYVEENCIPVITLDIDVVDFLAAYQSQVDWDKVKIGSVVNIYYPDFNIDTTAQLREISIDFQTNNLKFVISTYRQYSKNPFEFIAAQIRKTYDDKSNKLIYSHDENSFANNVYRSINEKVEEKGFKGSETSFKFGAEANTGETSSEISGEGFVSKVIGVNPVLETFIYEDEKKLTIADGRLLATNQTANFTTEVEVSGDNGFVIRRIDENDIVERMMSIDDDGNISIIDGSLSIGQTIKGFDQVGIFLGIDSNNPKISLKKDANTFLKYNPTASFNLEIEGNAKIGPLFVGNDNINITTLTTTNTGLSYFSGANPITEQNSSATLNLNDPIGQEITSAGVAFQSISGSNVFAKITFYDDLNGTGTNLGSFDTEDLTITNGIGGFVIGYNIRNVRSIKVDTFTEPVNFTSDWTLQLSGIQIDVFKPSLQINNFLVNSSGELTSNKISLKSSLTTGRDSIEIIPQQNVGTNYRFIRLSTPETALTGNRVIRLPDLNGTIKLIETERYSITTSAVTRTNTTAWAISNSISNIQPGTYELTFIGRYNRYFEFSPQSIARAFQLSIYFNNTDNVTFRVNSYFNSSSGAITGVTSQVSRSDTASDSPTSILTTNSSTTAVSSSPILVKGRVTIAGTEFKTINVAIRQTNADSASDVVDLEAGASLFLVRVA